MQIPYFSRRLRRNAVVPYGRGLAEYLGAVLSLLASL